MVLKNSSGFSDSGYFFVEKKITSHWLLIGELSPDAPWPLNVTVEFTNRICIKSTVSFRPWDFGNGMLGFVCRTEGINMYSFWQ